MMMYFFIVDQQAEFDFNSVGSLTQQCTGRHVAPMRHIIRIWSNLNANVADFIVCVLTRQHEASTLTIKLLVWLPFQNVVTAKENV